MPFIEDIAEALDYNVVCVNLKSLEDLRGTAIVKKDEQSGHNYYEFKVEWEDAINNSDKKSLLLFNIDNADDRLVNALKSIVEKHDEKYFVGLITSDKTRNLKGTTTFGLVKPSIIWD